MCEGKKVTFDPSENDVDLGELLVGPYDNTVVLEELRAGTKLSVNVFGMPLAGEEKTTLSDAPEPPPINLPEIKCKTSAKADIILLVDGSWSIGRQNFQTIRAFIGRMVGVFNIGPNLVQIGLAQYSGDPKTEWHLNAYKTRKELLDAVANLPYKGGNTMTGLALNYILQNNFRPNVGLRPDSKKIGVLITDGKSQDEIIKNSENLRKEGIELYAVGVKNADEDELRSIASDPDDIHMYNVEDFSFLQDIVDGLTDNLCNSVKGSGGPEPPTNLETSEVTHRSFRATWTAPAGSVEKYRLEYMIAVGGPTHEMSVNGTVTTAVLNNLNPLTEYIVKVFAVSGNVSSEPLKGTETTQIKCKTSAKADIILLVDGSSSIGRLNFQTIRAFIGHMVGVFNIGPNLVQIGLAQYSGDPKTEWHLNAYKTRKELLDAVANLPYKGGNTMTGLALNYILQNNFRPNVGLRPDSKKIGVLITDGKSQDRIIKNSENLRKEGIELYAVGVKNADEDELRSIASDPDDIHMYNVEDFSFLQDIVDGLTDNLCNSVKGSEIKCKTSAKADIILLVDGSWSIGRQNFQTIRAFIGRMVGVFNIGPNLVQIGLAQYSGDPKTEWHLNAYKSCKELLDAVANLPYKGGNTMTGLALNYILQNNFRPNVGLRPDSKKIGVLITDGKSQDEIIKNSENLRKEGIELYAVGVKHADEDELRSIASDPDDIHMYNVEDFSFLQNIVDGLTDNLCNSVKGSEIKCKTSAKADIILLVDGSWSIGRQNFQTIRTFIGRMVGVFNIGPNLVQIGLAQYSGDPKTEWHLNAYKTRKELLDAVANLPYKGGNTMTGLALNYILQNNFRPNVGLRPDSKKIGVLITDGKSQDEIIKNSENLRNEGIELYAIGVKNADEDELRSIASDPDDIHMYNVEDFSFLQDIVDGLTGNLCNSVKSSDGPEPPTNLETSEMTHRSFRATWTAPAGSVETYRLEYMIAAGGPTHEMSVNETVTTAVLNNLNPLTEYIVKVFAVSGDVSSEPLKGTETTLPVPSARNLRVFDETTTTMKVRWDAAAGATGYQLLYRAVNATVPSEEKEVRVGGGVTEVQLEHLFPNTLYSLSLIALHGEEASDPTVINQSWTKLMPGFNTV
ncbi:collagen alpha-1(XII) chain-like [Conger conger]|uniref:collagen alpha-1(XII) chain-like n=1 Tax=Conger conger TaxID=82655 RepID=UPI002A5AD85E|nr:collagen alpha-1(XII) chain-like [Conger conger]